MKKWKALLSAVAALCTLSLFAACGDVAPDTTSDSTPGASVPGDSTPDASTPDASTPDASTPDAPKTITVTWKNGDDVLETDEGVAADATHTYDGETPEKSGDAQYSYVFKGWDDGVTDADGNVTYTAQFDPVVNKYVVKFVLEDGTELQ